MIRRKKIFGIVCLVLLCFFIATQAVAESPGVTKEEPSVFAHQTGTFLWWILDAMLRAISFLAQMFDTFVRFAINVNIPVIANSWGVIRNFCNMFFILIIIIMAFATIFDIGGYQANQKLIVQLLMVALLINFSLTLGGLFIQGIDQINNIFISGLGNISARFAQAFNVGEIFGTNEPSFIRSVMAMMAIGGCNATGLQVVGVNCVQAGNSLVGNPEGSLTWALTFRLLFSIILVGMIGFGLLIATIFVVIRVPFLWFLLIFSPLAALASILPATRPAWEQWKKEFLSWNLFLPIYLFVLYFGMYLLSNQQQVMAGLAAFPNEFLVAGSPAIGFSIQFVFFYILIGIVLYAGTGFALSISRAASGSAVNIGYKWSRAAMNKIPYISPAARGISDAAKYRGERIRQEGVGVGRYKFFGAQSAERQEAQVAQLFGKAGAKEDAYGKQIKYFETRFKDENWTPERLKSLAESTTAPVQQRIAAYRRMKDMKLTGAEDLKRAYGLYKGTVGRSSAVDFAKDIDFKKDFDKGERAEWFHSPDSEIDPMVKQRVAKTMAEEGEFEIRWKGENQLNNDLLRAVGLFMSPQNKTIVDGISKEINNAERDRILTQLTLGNNEKRVVREFLEKASGKRVVESYSLLNTLRIPNPRHDDGSAYNMNDLEKKLAEKEAPDMLKLIAGIYDADNDVMKKFEELNPDQKLLFETLRKVVEGKEKRDPKAKEKFIRNLYNQHKATPEQIAAIRKFAEQYKVDLDTKETVDQGDAQSQQEEPPKADGARANNPNNTIDLRNT